MNQHKVNIIKALKKTSVQPFIKENEEGGSKTGYSAIDALNEAYNTFHEIEDPDQLLEIATELYADKVGVDVSEAKVVINDILENDYFETIGDSPADGWLNDPSSPGYKEDEEECIDPAGGKHKGRTNYMQYANKIANYLNK